MRKLRVAVCTLILASVGCDNNDNVPTVMRKDAPSKVTKVASSESVNSARLSAPGRQKLAQQSAGRALTLLDLSETQLDGAVTLVLMFSIPLDPDQDFSCVTHVVDKKSGKVDGAWELSHNLKELRLRCLEPKCDLIVTIGKEARALNNATLSRDDEKAMTTRDIQPSVDFASRGSLLPDKVVEGLPVTALNINDVDINFFHVRPESLLTSTSQREYRDSLASWQLDRLLQMANLVYARRSDLNPAHNTCKKLLLPLGGIKPLQQAGVYPAVMNQAGRYDCSNPAMLFTLSNIGVSAYHYHNRLDISTQSLENGTARQGIEVSLLNKKGQTLTQTISDTQGYVQLENGKDVALLLVRKNGRTMLFNLELSVLDLAGFNIVGVPGYSEQFFMFGPRGLYRPGETAILNGSLRDADGKALLDQSIKLDVIKSDGQVLESAVSQPEDGPYHLTWPLDSNTITGIWHTRANTDDNQHRVRDSHVEDFVPERMALNLAGEKTPLMPEDEAKFFVVGRYLYGAPTNGSTLQEQSFPRPLREAVLALPGFELGDIAVENLSRTLGEVQLTLGDKGHDEVSTESQWKETHSPLQIVFQGSLLESDGRPVTRHAEQAIWPADTLPGIRPQFALKSVYDHRTDSTVKQPVVDEGSNAAFDITYSDVQGVEKVMSDLQMHLIRERRDYYWNWSECEG